jgi:succinoglycan biosynthesis protein ExoA
MPVRNEERHLAEAVARVLAQEYPGGFELILAVGPSRDRTLAIARSLASSDPRVTVLENPSGRIPSALNLAVAAARHDLIARIDGHALLPPGYLISAVRTLLSTGAADVGGVMAAEGVTAFQRAVAWSMRSRVGVGSAEFHTGGTAGPALTAYLGIYRRQAILDAGGWDEAMQVAEDWELNYRIRASGGLIWFDPSLIVTYRPRATLGALAVQYFRYGRWRRVVTRQYPDTVSLRYMAPPAACALNLAGLLLGIAGLAAGVPSLAFGFIVPVIYLLGVIGAGLGLSRGAGLAVRLRIPLILATMHMCWGAGFLTSPKRLARRTRSATVASPLAPARARSGERP